MLALFEPRRMYRLLVLVDCSLFSFGLRGVAGSLSALKSFWHGGVLNDTALCWHLEPGLRSCLERLYLTIVMMCKSEFVKRMEYSTEVQLCEREEGKCF